MRKLVHTMLIMLPAVLGLSPWGNVAVSSAYASQKTLPLTHPVPFLFTRTPAACKEYDPTAVFTRKIDEKPSILLPVEKTEEATEPDTFVDAISLTVPTPEIENDIPVASETALPLQSLTTPTPAAGSSGGLNAEVIFGMVNQHRINAGLPPFEKHPEVCSIAESRRYEIENEVYGNSYMHAGFQARHLPYWATENMISQQTETEAVAWWMNSSVHRSAILGGHKYACVICQNKTCAMIFSSLETK